MVETYTSKIIAWSRERGIHDYADCGGGPNACMLGSDGAVYITQNGGTVGAWRAEVMSVPSIQKAAPDGSVEILVTEVDGIALQAPNDLSFGPDGRLYFTDPADYLPDDRKPGRVFVLNPDGTGECLAELPSAYPNGIVAEADGSVVWVESYDRGVYRIRPGGQSEQFHQLPEGHIPDGLKVDRDGNLWITTFMSGGVDIMAPDGTCHRLPRDRRRTAQLRLPRGRPAHHGLRRRRRRSTADAPMDGRLWRVAVGVEGMPLFRGRPSAR